MKNRLFSLTIIAILMLSSCKQGSEKLIGKWQTDVHSSTWNAQIVKEGSNLMLIGGGIYGSEDKFPLLNDGKNFYVEEPFGKMILIYNGANDKIVFNGKDWNRVP